MEIVAYLPEVKDYLTELIDILFEKEYFSYKESAINYINELIDFIDTNASKTIYKTCPKELNHLGDFYFTYKANQHTTWYIFVEKLNQFILVTYIINNHSPKFAKFNFDN